MKWIGRFKAKFSPLQFLLLIMAGSVHSGSAAENIRVAVAANFAETVEQLASLFTRQTRHEITVIPGSTGRLYAQIINGAPFDVFLSADADRPRLLAEQGIGLAASRGVYAIGRLVLWQPGAKSSEEVIESLRAGNFNHLSLANPRVAPYGAAAMEVIESLGMIPSIAPQKMVMGESITQAFQFVATGNSELGFVALAQVLDQPPSSYWLIPTSMHSSIVQELIILRDSKAAALFVEFITGDSARNLIAAEGYDLPDQGQVGSNDPRL